MELAEAREIAVRTLNAGGLPGSPQERVILDQNTIERPFGWVFFYQSRAFVENGDEGAQLVGNAPLIIDRRDSSTHFTGTDQFIDHYIEEYERAHPDPGPATSS